MMKKRNKTVYVVCGIGLLMIWLLFFHMWEKEEKLYESVENEIFRAIKYTQSGQAILLNKEGEEVSSAYDDINAEDIEAGLYYIRFSENDKFGYLQAWTGKPVVEAAYQEATPFIHGMTAVGDGKQKWFINKSGKKISETYDDIQILENNYEYAFVKREERWGVVETSNFQQIVPFEYEMISDLTEISDEIILSGIRGRSAAILRDEELVEIPNCREISPMYLRYFCIITNEQDQKAIINLNGNLLVDFGVYQEIGAPKNNYISVKDTEGLYGLLYCNNIDNLIYEIIPTEYETEVVLNSLGNAMVKKDGQYGVVTIAGFQPLDYKEARPFVNDRSAVLTDQGWGYVNEKLEVIVESFYKKVSDYEEDYAVAEDKTGFFYVVDKEGEIVYRAVDEIKSVTNEYIICKGDPYYSLSQIKKDGQNGGYTVETLYDEILQLDSLDLRSYYSALFENQEKRNVWTLMSARKYDDPVIAQVWDAMYVTRLYHIGQEEDTW